MQNVLRKLNTDRRDYTSFNVTLSVISHFLICPSIALKSITFQRYLNSMTISEIVFHLRFIVADPMSDLFPVRKSVILCRLESKIAPLNHSESIVPDLWFWRGQLHSFEMDGYLNVMNATRVDKASERWIGFFFVHFLIRFSRWHTSILTEYASWFESSSCLSFCLSESSTFLLSMILCRDVTTRIAWRGSSLLQRRRLHWRSRST